MKNSSQTQHHRSETKRKEEQKIEEIRKKRGCRMQDAGCRKQGANGTVAAGVRTVNFAGIAKFSQGLRKFRNHSENFAIIAKISQS